jgi:tRNA(Ile)-lysidine synthase
MSDLGGKTLLELMLSWPHASACRVAFSGGVDSTVLLHLLAGVRSELPGPLSAIHINHGLHERSPEWDQHCRTVCRDWGIEFASCSVDARPVRGHSPEEWARTLRYEALEKQLTRGELLLTAHHQDDQVETLILHLCRGTGPAGLSGMQAWRPFGAGGHGRPLLAWGRSEIAAYATGHKLQWLEDPSNADGRLDRNFVRLELVPLLRSRWPGAGATLSRVAELQAEANTVLGEVAAQDLAACRSDAPHRLRLAGLAALSWPRQANVLRHWIASLSLPVPARSHVSEMRQQLLVSRPDAAPKVAWPGAEVRRFRDELWAGAPLPPRDARERLSWCLREPCDLAHGRLSAQSVVGRGLRRSALEGDSAEVRFRRGGEAILPVADRHHRALKKLLHEARVPPWLRGRLPLLYLGDRLVAVADLWLEASMAATAAESGWEITWHDNAG